MPKITFPTTIGTLSENLGSVLDAYFLSTAAGINAAARYRGAWSSTLDAKAHDLFLYNGALWDALVDSVNVPPVAGTSWRQVARVLGTGSVTTDDIATGGQISKEQLEYIATSDFANGVALAAGTWVDIVANQSFTVERADNRQVNVFPSGCILITPTGSSGGRWAARLIFDSAGAATPLAVGAGWVGANSFQNTLQGTGTPRIQGLAAGAHTVKLQVKCEVAATVNCRASSAGDYENFKLRVVEGKR